LIREKLLQYPICSLLSYLSLVLFIMSLPFHLNISEPSVSFSHRTSRCICKCGVKRKKSSNFLCFSDKIKQFGALVGRDFGDASTALRPPPSPPPCPHPLLPPHPPSPQPAPNSSSLNRCTLLRGCHALAPSPSMPSLVTRSGRLAAGSSHLAVRSAEPTSSHSHPPPCRSS
jgi:hypothetical protein